MPRIEIYQSLWAMERRRPGVPESPLETQFQTVAEAGFDGLGLDLAMSDIPTARAAEPLFARHGLKCLFNGFPHSEPELAVMLSMARDFGCPFLSVIGQVMPPTVEGMIDLVRRWMDIAHDAGVPLLFETHRHGLLNDLHSTLAVLDAVPEVGLCADLSHFVVDREFPLPIAPPAQAMMARVLSRSVTFQGRVASGEQIQLQTDFPHHQAWVEQFYAWWELGLKGWRSRARPGDTVRFLCELGPAPYAMTDKEGLELSDRWAEALVMRARIADLWRRLETEEAPQAARASSPAKGL